MSEGLTFSSIWDILLLETKVSDEDSVLSKVSPRELALAGSFFMSKQIDCISTFFSTSDNSPPYPARARVLTYALQRLDTCNEFLAKIAKDNLRDMIIKSIFRLSICRIKPSSGNPTTDKPTPAEQVGVDKSGGLGYIILGSRPAIRPFVNNCQRSMQLVINLRKVFFMHSTHPARS